MLKQLKTCATLDSKRRQNMLHELLLNGIQFPVVKDSGQVAMHMRCVLSKDIVQYNTFFEQPISKK